jgi:hypothetical protein
MQRVCAAPSSRAPSGPREIDIEERTVTMSNRRAGSGNRTPDRHAVVTLKRRTRDRRPGFDALEARTMLSAAPLNIATLGDSLTDEYEFYPPDRTAAQNWVEILSSLRGGQDGNPDQISFGAFSSKTRGETRNQGYAQNWARSGATASAYDFNKYTSAPYDLQQELYGIDPKKGMYGLLNQPGGLANINVVTLLIGGNDFDDSILNELLHDKTISQIRADLFGFTKPNGLTKDVVDPIESAVTKIEDTALKDGNPNLDILLVTTPNVTLTPLVNNDLSALGTGGAIIKYLLSSTASAIDTKEIDYVDGKIAHGNSHIAYLDINSLFGNFTMNPVIDGMTVDPNGAGPLASDLFVGDGFHPGTIAQGILAQNIAAQIDQWYPGAITPISDADIVSEALAAQPVTSAALSASTSLTTSASAEVFTLTVKPFIPQFPDNVTPDQEPFPNPAGNVTFLDSNNGTNIVLGTVPLLSGTTIPSNGVATFSTTTLPFGVNVITAVYNGNTVYPPASPAPVTVTVDFYFEQE